MAGNTYVPGSSNWVKQEAANAATKAAAAPPYNPATGGKLVATGAMESDPFPAGGPTVPGSSTGIGSTFSPQQAATYDSTTTGPKSYYSIERGGTGYVIGGNVGGIQRAAAVEQVRVEQRQNNALINVGSSSGVTGLSQQSNVNFKLNQAQQERDKAFSNYLKNPGMASRLALGQREEELTRAKLNPEQKERLKNLTLLEGAVVTLPFAGFATVGGTAASIIGGSFLGLGLPGTTKDIVRSTSKAINDKSVPFSYEEQIGAGTAGFNRVNEKASQQGLQIPFIGSSDQIINNILPGSTYARQSNRQNFESGATEYFKGLGYNEATSKSYANKVLNIEGAGGAAGEVASLFPVGAIGEIGVRTGVSQAVSKMGLTTKQETANYIGGAAFKSAILPAATEGTVMYTSQQTARRQPVTFEGIATSAGLSAVTGGLGARWIAKGSITNPKVTNLVYKGLWVVQPDEPAGDIAASVLNRAAGKSTSTQIKYFNPTINTGGITQTNAFPVSKDSIYNLNQKNVDKTLPTNIVNENGVITPAPTPTFTPSSITPSFPVSNNSIYNENYSSSNTYTNTYTNTWSNTATFAASTNAPFAPFLLPNINFSGLGQGGRSRKRATEGYYDELKAATNAYNYLNETIGFQVPGFVMPGTSWLRKKKKSKRRR
jgi:hypothetical protein